MFEKDPKIPPTEVVAAEALDLDQEIRHEVSSIIEIVNKNKADAERIRERLQKEPDEGIRDSLAAQLQEIEHDNSSFEKYLEQLDKQMIATENTDDLIEELVEKYKAEKPSLH